ncbi:MAG: hypothetical protein U5L96_19470 [Owenweeksia sp.]|nr:hypothetical protein [Owenweeksia sp.]
MRDTAQRFYSSLVIRLPAQYFTLSFVSSTILYQMDFYSRKNLWKFILLLFAVLIGAATLWYTESFLKQLREQEVRRVEQFAEATRRILNAGLEEDITFEQEIIQSSTTVPILLTDEEGHYITSRNMNEQRLRQDSVYFKQKLAEMRAEAQPIPVLFAQDQIQYLYYQNSTLLTKLRYYPLVLLLVISLFIVIAYIAFSNARKAEQDRVWNGLAKETAHQIGTPLHLAHGLAGIPA